MLKEKTMKSNKANLDALMEAYKSMEKEEEIDERVFGLGKKSQKELKDELEAIEAQLEADREEGVKADADLIARRNKIRDQIKETVEESEELEEDYAGATSYVKGMKDHLRAMFAEIENQPEENQRDIFEIVGKLFMRAAQEVK
jgi:chromosome segregation ATPase